jgi:hypothetical protein
MCRERNIEVIETFSPYLNAILASEGMKPPSESIIPNSNDDNEIRSWVSTLTSSISSIKCAISESDVGTPYAERIQRALSLPSNGISPQLRSKYLMNEYCKLTGLEVNKQILSNNWDDSKAFIESISSDSCAIIDCVVKPQRGVASSDVYLCTSLLEAENAFNKLLNASTFGGGKNDVVLIQEFAVGQEYAVDAVTKDGKVKIMALWKYDKRSMNGAPFVYQCTELVCCDSQEGVKVIDYCIKCLEAVGHKWGPTHTEIVLTKNGPRLIEINGRWQNSNFLSLVKRSLDRDALSSTLDIYFDPENFDHLSDAPNFMKESGMIVHLANKKSGVIMAINHLDEISKLDSYRSMEIFVAIGETVTKTIDIRTDFGYILLCHENYETLIGDYKKIINDLQDTILEVYQP